MRYYIIILLGIVLLGNSCTQKQVNEMNAQPAETIPPDDLYFLDKVGEATPSFLAAREQEIEFLKNSIHLNRSAPVLIPGNWTTQGPGNLGGRINTIAMNPKNENIIFVGFSHGGAYRTIDGGKNWTAIFDQESNLYIGSIEIDPVNPNTIYIGTGDPNGGFYCGQGNGIYKSIDNGKTWIHLGLSETRIISKVIVDYKNPQTIFAASLGYSYEKNEHRGIYKSSDGGQNWIKALYTNDSSGITDLVMHPNDPQTLFAVSWNKLGLNNRSVVSGPDGQIFKSVNGGQSWKKLTSGLPSDSLNGRIALAISKSNPNILYARYIRTYRCDNSVTNNLYAIYKSTDTGENWTELPSLAPSSGLECGDTGGFGWYFQNIAVAPDDPNALYIMAIELFYSDDGGINWIIPTPRNGSVDVHADKHAMAFYKNGDYLLGTDGGLYKYIKATNTWIDLEDIPTNQIYRVGYNLHEQDLYYGGLQDNGTTSGNKFNLGNWDRIYGGDGFQMAFNKEDPTIFYAEYQNGALQQYYHGDWRGFTRGLGGNKNWDFPYMISRFNSQKLIAGSSQIYVNPIDTIAAWTAISPNLVSVARYPSRSSPSITTLDQSPIDSNVIIAGTVNGNVWMTKQFDKGWTNVSSNLPAAYITSVKTSYLNTNTFYASLSGHRGNNFNAYVYKSTNNGLSWSSIQGDLPNLPVYDFLVYPDNKDSILFVGNHIGVYASVDAGNTWLRVGDNMPYIEVYDLEINESEKTLIAGTFGKSIMSFPLENILRTLVKTKDDLPALSISIMPNPASNKITISNTNLLTAMQINICNQFGQSVWLGVKSKEGDLTIDISSFNKGIYFISYRGKKQVGSSSFVKI